MIYVSSSCVKARTIREIVEILFAHGFKDIELSGGTEYYDGIHEEVVALNGCHGMNFLIHNYFPPSKEHFVLNLASLDNSVYERTVAHLTSSIELCKKLGLHRFGFHGGFYMDIDLNEVGKKIGYKPLVEREKAIERFCDGFNLLRKIAGDGFDLYIENNVLSSSNHEAFIDQIPLMLVDFQGYLELKRHIDFKLLLDIGHLKVSCRSLGLDFDAEFEKMAACSDYLHVSDNDGLHDQNSTVTVSSDIFSKLKSHRPKGKTFTLEVYDGVEELRRAYEVIRSIE